MRLDRRTLLKGMAAGAPVAAPLTQSGTAGASGLRWAHELWVGRGIPSTVYQWDGHGGRVLTFRDVFANGQIIEERGEPISSEHRSMLQLARQFGLQIENTDNYPSGAEDTFWVGGHR